MAQHRAAPAKRFIMLNINVLANYQAKATSNPLFFERAKLVPISHENNRIGTYL
jgi:hypothetical protein